MAIVRNYNFKVEVIREGQSRPYADSEYEYLVTSDCPEFVVKEFCTKVLRPKNQEHKDWDRNDINSFFRGYYTFEKKGENTYRYYVREPYTD